MDLAQWRLMDQRHRWHMIGGMTGVINATLRRLNNKRNKAIVMRDNTDDRVKRRILRHKIDALAETYNHFVNHLGTMQALHARPALLDSAAAHQSFMQIEQELQLLGTAYHA